jgi:hypothetical protein
MNFQHRQLAGGRWQELTFLEQMANVGSEIERTIIWRNKGNAGTSRRAYDRALELLDMTISDKRNKKRLKELARLRESLNDYFIFENSYNSTDKNWRKYFFHFNFAVRIRT